MPQRWAVRMTSIHCAVESLLRERIVPDFVVENFGGRAGQRAETVVAQHREIVGERHAGEFDAVDDFHRREGVDVHAGHGSLHRAQNVAIVKRRQTVRQSALNADLGRAELPGFDGLLRDLIRLEKIRVGFARAAAEGAELASHKTDVGEVDVAIHDVGDEVAGKFGAQQVGGGEQAEQIVAFGVGQSVSFFLRDGVAVLSFENSLQRRAHAGASSARCRTSRAKESFPVPEVESSRGTRSSKAVRYSKLLLEPAFWREASGTDRWRQGEAGRERGHGRVRTEIRE